MLTASDTAYAIAVIRAREADFPESERLFEDPYARLFADAGEHAREGTERFLALPFFRDGIRLRTRHIDDVVREALSHGARQLVLMGAGFDSRALRMPEVAQRGAHVFEIDLPLQLEAKRGLLAGAGVVIPGNVRYVPCDFASEFEDRLQGDLLAQGFDRSAPTMFVWEGVLAYIDQRAKDRSLRFMASIGGPGSRLIFDFATPVLEPEEASKQALRAGFASFHHVGFDDLWRRHLPGDPAPSAVIMKLGVASKEPDSASPEAQSGSPRRA
ncbi:MAG: SAM-dependent methyltransferase [Polyangiaceae bacterium]